jgi:hypothetical protein
MARWVAAGIPDGLLGYLDGEPVAWCSVVPGSACRRLASDGAHDGRIRAIICFFIVKRLRGPAMTRRIIQAAVDHARICGASAIEEPPQSQAKENHEDWNDEPWPFHDIDLPLLFIVPRRV